MKRIPWALVMVLALLPLIGCGSNPDPNTLVMIIESSPTNLDPRVGIDGQSERIDGLLFDYLLARDNHLNVQPELAESWETPDPKTYIFHLHHGVRFHNGAALTSRDVKWTFDSIFQKKIRTTKTAAYLDHIETPDETTVVFHLKAPFAPLLWNLSDGSVGIVPYGTTQELSQHPIGSGPFRFVSAEQDKEVILERNDDYWGEKAKISRVRFAVVPDDTTRALELRKGTADVISNALPFDTVVALKREPDLTILHGPGTILAYMAFNLRDPILRDVRVRQALAYALDRDSMMQYLGRGYERSAYSILPPESWAYDGDVPRYDYDPAKARSLLDQAGYPLVNGARFHLTMKTSTEGSTRVLAAVLQQQLHEVGVALDIRAFEFATFFSDVTHGAFQLYSLRWISGNEDPDIFEYVFDTKKFTPDGANRGFYSNPKVDVLIDQAKAEIDQNVRKQLYAQVQQILADDLPYINLWYYDNVIVHTRRVSGITLNPSGNYSFLKTAKLSP